MYTVSMVSLGCDKNLIDGEKMLGTLINKGYKYTKDKKDIDILIINTCGFIESAKEESIDTILAYGEKKKQGDFKYLIVTGCLAQRYHNDLLEKIPEIDGIAGTGNYHEIEKLITNIIKGKGNLLLKSPESIPVDWEIDRVPLDNEHIAYLKIAEGCDRKCTYCVIPSLRGKYRSRTKESIIKESKSLIKKGVKEIILIAQDTGSYGLDIYGKCCLDELLDEISSLEGDFWIRILYCYPDRIDDNLIRAISKNNKVCNYLDIPLQHCNNKILQKMGRKTSKEFIKEIVKKLRKSIPDIVLRTTFIVGFPGEGEEEFKELLDFIEEMKFNHVGVFSYSREEGTPAYRMKQIPVKERKRRADFLLLMQQSISNLNNEKLLNKTLKVIIDGFDKSNSNYIGRYYGQSPEIDGIIYINGNHLPIGTFCQVKIANTYDYDLTGVVINEPGK